MSATVQIRARPARLRLIAAVWTGFTLVALAVIGESLRQPTPALMALLFVCGDLCLLLSVTMLALCIRTLNLRGPLIEFLPEGFTDHRICARMIPWHALDWRLTKGRNGTTSVQFATTEAIAAFWPYRLLARLYRALGMPPWLVLSLGTGLTGAELAQQFAAFKPARR